MIQWLRLHALNIRSLGLIPGQGTRFHVLQLRVVMLQMKELTIHNKDQRSCMPQLRPRVAQ